MMTDKIMCNKTNKPEAAMGKNEPICTAPYIKNKAYSANLSVGKSNTAL